MEETDALAIRAAILSKRILALGTTDYLRQKYGNVYHVHLVLKSTPTSTREETDTVEQWINHSFSGVSFGSYGHYHGQIKFSVPAEASAAEEEVHGEDSTTRVDGRRGSSGVGALFSVLEENKEKMELQFYSVWATTMDEVFVNVAREQADYQKGSAKISTDTGCCQPPQWQFDRVTVPMMDLTWKASSANEIVILIKSFFFSVVWGSSSG
jgi:hypothetical protein